MEMQDTHKGYWRINKGKTKILVHPGSAHPYKSKADFYEIRRVVRSLYTEEQLFEYFCRITTRYEDSIQQQKEILV